MDFMTAIKTCFNNYVTFAGRASRAEYWYFVLFLVLGNAVFGILDVVMFPDMGASPMGSIFSLVTFLPSIAVTARRLHDIDKSGWWQLLWIIPVIGWIILLIWTSSIGTRGPNRFGESLVPVPVPV